MSVSSVVPGPADLASIALGVGHRFSVHCTYCAKVTEWRVSKLASLRGLNSSVPFASLAVGVGHLLTAASNPTWHFVPSGLYAVALVDHVLPAGGCLLPYAALGVGQNEDAVPLVRGANGGSWYAVPLRVIPALGQVSENSSEPQGKVPWDVFQQDVAGSYCANDSEDFGPKMTLVKLSLPVPGETERLAWVASGE